MNAVHEDSTTPRFRFCIFELRPRLPSSTRWMDACAITAAGCMSRGELWQLKIVLSGISSLHIINRHAYTPWYMFFNKCEHFFIITAPLYTSTVTRVKQHITPREEKKIIHKREAENLLFKCESSARKRIQNAVIHAKAIKNFPLAGKELNTIELKARWAKTHFV